MIEDIFFVLGGLILLTVGGELLVRCSSRIASAYGISPLVVGLTIVALGTSAPELGVSLFAALQGKPEIALTNVVGSNIFNIGFILGLCALVSPLVVQLKLLKFDIPIMILASIAVYFFCRDLNFVQIEGIVLVVCAAIYLYWIVRAAKKEPKNISDNIELAESKTKRSPLGWNLIYMIISLGVLVVGSRLLVSGAEGIAKAFGVSESLIGLTIVAAGTSLPEVATSVMATLRGQTDIAVGNVIGSNILNIFLILGVSAGLNTSLAVPEALVNFDLVVMIGVAFICYPLLVTSRKLVRWEGALLLAGYAGYTAILIVG